jgi:hypothetical protein
MVDHLVKQHLTYLMMALLTTIATYLTVLKVALVTSMLVLAQIEQLHSAVALLDFQPWVDLK